MTPHTTSFAILMLVALTACGSKDEGNISLGTTPESASEASPSAPGEILSTEAPTTVAAPITISAPVAPTAASGANPFGGNAPEDFLMPFVVCLNLQEAQDEIQDHGVFYSRSEDATGQGRMQLNDSNWQVVAQRPEQGSPIGEGDAVLVVVKYGEQPNPC